MEDDRGKGEPLPISAQIEAGRRLRAEARQQGLTLRRRAVPEAVLQSLGSPQQLLLQLRALSDEQIVSSIMHIGCDLGTGYRPLLVSVLETRSFNAEVRGASASGLGQMFTESHDKDVCDLLRLFLFDDSESPYVRERCYFAILLILDRPPFLEPDERWPVLFDSFTFPRDVNWSSVR